MNAILKYRKRISWVFLSGYLLLIAYSGFHFHKIAIQNTEAVTCSHTGSNSGNFDLINSLFTCQFNLVYNTTYTFDQNNSEESALVVLVEKGFLIIEKVPSKDSPTSNQLRAPPVFPVIS